MPEADSSTEVNSRDVKRTIAAADEEAPSLGIAFRRVASLVRDSTIEDSSVSTTDKLRLYGLYKHATSGPVDESQTPSMLRVTAYAKFQAWVSCKDLTVDQAMHSYVELVATYHETVVGEQALGLLRELDEKKPLNEIASVENGEPSPPKSKRKSTRIRSFIPRGQLDISYSDLAFAAWECTGEVLWPKDTLAYQRRVVNNWKLGPRFAMEGLSARTLLDLYLRVKKYPPGSKVIVSPPITVPGMQRVLEYHKLEVIPIDLPSENHVAVDSDAIEKVLARDNQIVAVMVVHVFGMMAGTEKDMEQLSNLCNVGGVELWEDCAECFDGRMISMESADLSLYSFGLIKTATALGGGIALVKSKATKEAMRRLMSSRYDKQSPWHYAWKIFKALSLRILSDLPLLCGWIMTVCTVLGLDMDDIVTSLLRGFSPKPTVRRLDYMHQIRKAPCASLLALMDRRLRQSIRTSRIVSCRKDRCEMLTESLADNRRLSLPTFASRPDHTHWLCPIMSGSRDSLCRYLQRQHGFDATSGASQLTFLGTKAQCPRAASMMSRVVYLPLSHPAMVQDEQLRLQTALDTYRRKEKESFRQISSRSFLSWKMLALIFLPCPIFIRLELVVKILLLGFQLTISLFIISLIAGQFLRWISATLYLGLSSSFAKYAYVFDDSTARDSTEINGTLFENDSPLAALRLTCDCTSPRTVVLTGATGFIGSMLLRDLLVNRQVLSIKCIIVISRGRRGRTAHLRIQDLLVSPMFSFLPEHERDSLVRVVAGDITKANAGISPEELSSIRRDPSITHIFHCAAAVSFTQSMADAAQANIFSSLVLQKMTSDLCFQKAQFVHISTAFVHGSQCGSKEKPLTEQLFSLAPYDALEIYKSMRTTQYYASKAMAELGFHNTYSFSKCVAEHLLRRNAVKTVIIRPSIVGPALVQPRPGWSGSKPSTIVAAPCLYFSFHFNLWSFGNGTVPCIPVDVLSRYILAKTMHSDTISGIETDSSVSSDEGFQKIHRKPSETENPISTKPSTFKLFNAAWDASSCPKTQFTWIEYAGAIAQAGCVFGHVSRPTAYLGLLVATRWLPNAALSTHKFEQLHKIVVERPMSFAIHLLRLFGWETFSTEKVVPFLNLSVLFYPFMNNIFHFSSELVAPSTINGEIYMLRCVSAAHNFAVATKESRVKSHSKRHVLSSLSIAGSDHEGVVPDVVWSAMQARGSPLTQLAAWFLSQLFRLTLTQVTIDATSFCGAIENLKERNTAVTIILAPTHRSFFDFLLVSYAFFALPELQIHIPFIAAADAFEELPVLGRLAGMLGAFFVKRGKGTKDPALREAIRTLPPNASIEVFIEGTRSRDRRFVEPKTGFLRCLQSTDEPYLVIPISISYEALPDQGSLSSEARGEQSSGLSFIGLLSWLQRAIKGHISLGRVHLSASKHLTMDDRTSKGIPVLANTIQQSLVDQTFISSYHVSALASFIKVKPRIVEDALRKLGCRFFGETDFCERNLPLPRDETEKLTVALQTAPWLAPIFYSSRREWSRWLCHFCNHGLRRELKEDSSVARVADALLKLFDEAQHVTGEVIARLEEKGHRNPRLKHFLQEAAKDCSVSSLILTASFSMRVSSGQETPALEVTGSGTPVELALQMKKSLCSGEALGYWGFSDAAFVVQADRNGKPFVSFQGEHYDLHSKHLSRLIPFIEQEMDVRVDLMHEAYQLATSETCCTPCQLPDTDLATLTEVPLRISVLEHDRIRHATGHCQSDVISVRSRRFIRAPDVVIWPTSESDVQCIIATARQKNWCLIPFGGGTNVSQATSCPPLHVEPRPIVSVDMKNMAQVLSVDEENGVAHVQAGITGRALVDELGQRGYTMGHEPDSYEFSTLGGWIATKASGMKRNKYGNIEDIVKGVRVAGPNGILFHGHPDVVWGRESTGLDLRDLMMGSEGCLGIITSAVIRIWPTNRVEQDYDSVLFPHWEHGFCFVREIAKLSTSSAPASVRLLDNAHFRLGQALRPDDASIWESIQRAIGQAVVQWKWSDTQQIVCTTLLYEGTRSEIQYQKHLLQPLIQSYSGIRLGAKVGQSGYDLTFLIAYLRDFALTYHIVGESLETFCPWSKVERLIAMTKARIFQEHADLRLPGRPFVGCRVTQVYHEGACLYFYISAHLEHCGDNDASSVFSQLEHAARDEITKQGGSVSHHHGIGKVRASWLETTDSTAWQEWKRSIKLAYDPDNLFGARNGQFAQDSEVEQD